MKNQSASKIEGLIETLGIYLMLPRHASREGCRPARSESMRIAPCLQNSRGASQIASFLSGTDDWLQSQAPGLEPAHTASE